MPPTCCWDHQEEISEACTPHFPQIGVLEFAWISSLGHDVCLAREGHAKLGTIMCNVYSFDVEACRVDIHIGTDTILHPMHESNQVLESNHSDLERDVLLQVFSCPE